MNLNEIKSIIRSLVISRSTGMTIRELERDFKEHENMDIPFREFNCTSLEMFLNTIPDTVKLFGYGPSATVIPVINEKVAHIDQMIMIQNISQKKTSRYCNQRKARRRHPGLVLPSYSQSTPLNGFESLTSCQQTFDLRTDDSNSFTLKNFNGSSSVINNQPSMRLNINSPVTKACINWVPHNPASETKEAIESCGLKSSKASMVQSNADASCLIDGRVIPDYDLEDFIYSEDEDIFEVVGSFGSHIPTFIKDNLRILIKEAEDGIWCAKLPNLFKSRFGKKLDFEEFGYPRLINMCSDLGIFHLVCIDKGDYKLYDIDKPLPADAHLRFPTSKYCREERNTPNQPAILNEHELLMAKMTYPPDVLTPDEDIPCQWLLPGTVKGDFIDVRVGEVYDLSKFWIFLQHKECGDKLETLMDDLQQFYGRKHVDLTIPKQALKKNMMVVTVFMGEYHRAMVVKLCDNATAKVLFFDYGTVAAVKQSELCFMHSSFKYLPRQAIRARLVGVYPVEMNTQWPRDAAARFLQLVTNIVFSAYVHKIDEEMKEIGVILYGDGEDMSVCDILVAEGHAVSNTKVNEFNSSPPTGRLPGISSSTPPKRCVVELLRKVKFPKENLDNSDVSSNSESITQNSNTQNSQNSTALLLNAYFKLRNARKK